ncbi:prolyl aminopeptidase [Kibdelosporangium philippinense]|uniref:Proline iminopeptidase n=1 Tax=Kibdelosporangium philippinense TaxID=211113 RepID=A0ABS8ZLE8_9PSEU|nr:prolyl aminopeptidase [Kibdelosporangium philippinense]MCE7008317.1 prolyl aminopeptidase [Kibdelosporangium philippinense]
MRAFYPPIEPYDSGMLDVGAGHQVYWEVSGNPDGKPAVVVHGGPGSGSNPIQRRHFDPELYRIVLFDQRGAGKSTPHVSSPDHDLATNTTWHLVADMEKLREHLGIDRWLVLGGSWGATLALAYAQTHPSRVSEMVLRGVFMLRQSELDWLYGGGARNIFPDAWEKFVELVPDGADVLETYQKLVFGDDPEMRVKAALAWSNWEGATVSTQPNIVTPYGEEEFAVGFARIAVHYFVNKGWLDDGQLLRDVGKLKDIPAVIVNGRYDIVTPIVSAFELGRAWPSCEGYVLNGAGHAIVDPGISEELLAATDRFAGKTRAE